jgi:hypothetical protein
MGMARSKEADRNQASQSSILELARDVRGAQELRDAELERVQRSYGKAVRGSVLDAAEFLKAVQKGDAIYDQAMRQALRRYRAARTGGSSAQSRFRGRPRAY